MSDPITSNQNEVLVFFLGANHGITTKSDASKKIDGLLNDPSNAARWEDHNSKIPATKKQRERLNWWAEKLGRKLPSPLTKAQAHKLIEEWLEENPELEDEWYEQKEQTEEFEIETSIIADDVDEWREFYNCNKISDKKVRNVLKITGLRAANEPIDQFMNKFFAELHRKEPALFTSRQRALRSHSSSKSKGCLVLCILWLLLIGIIGAMAAH